MERATSRYKKPIAIAIGILLALIFLGYSCSTAHSPYEKEYSFPEAGFQAEFPVRPKVEQQDGIAEYKGVDKYKVSEVMYVTSDSILNREYCSRIEEYSEKEMFEEVIKPILGPLAESFISIYPMEGVDKNRLRYSEYGAITEYSGYVTYSGEKDFSDQGGSSHQQLGACVAVVLNDAQTYIIFEIRDSAEEAIKAAKTFSLIKRSGRSSGSSSSSTKSESIPNGAISWKDASKYIGETVTVYGPIVNSTVASSSNGSPTYLDMGAAYPASNRVSIVIWGEDAHNFPQSPVSMYEGKTVCVTGEVYSYSGACNIKVTSPSQVKIVG